MFANVVSIVTSSWSPINQELVLTDTVTYPVEPHVNSFCSFLLDSIICKSHCSSVIYLYWGWRLRMAKFVERNAKKEGITSG